MCVRAHVWVTCPTCLWLFPTLAVGLQMTEGSSVDVPVLFAPNSKELKRAWVCISMRPLGSPGNGMRYVHVSHYLSDRPYLYPVWRVSFCYLLHRGWFPANKTRNKYLTFAAIVPNVLWQHCAEAIIHPECTFARCYLPVFRLAEEVAAEDRLSIIYFLAHSLVMS